MLQSEEQNTSTIIFSVDKALAVFLCCCLTVFPLIASSKSVTATQTVKFARAARDTDTFGNSSAVDGDTLVIGSPENDDGGTDSGSVYVYYTATVPETGYNRQNSPPADAERGYFGASVSISGDILAVGAPGGGDIGSGIVYVYVRNGITWTQQQKLTVDDATAGSKFGHSISVSGETLLIGSPYNDSGGGPGSAYVFARSGNIWTQMQKLAANGGEAGDRFGGSVSIDGNTLAIGASGDDDNGNNSGSAYVFVFDGAVWTQQKKLTAVLGATNDLFGGSVSISGDFLAIGASGDDWNGSNSGSVYVFVRNGIVWSTQQKLGANEAAAQDRFGASVSINGNLLAVGAPHDSDGGFFKSGSAYVFVHNGTSWDQDQKLNAAAPTMAGYFGKSVSVSGSIIAIGANGGERDGISSGLGYLFVHDSLNWTQQREFAPGDAAAYDKFGSSLSFNQDILAAGTPKDDDLGVDSGSVYVFARSKDSWIRQAKLTVIDAAAGDLFGSSVSHDGNILAAGAPDDNDGINGSGSTYVFIHNGLKWIEQAKLTEGSVVSLSGDTLVIGVPKDNDHGDKSGAAYVFVLNGSAWTQQAKLTADDAAAGDRFGGSVSIDGDILVTGARHDDDAGASSGAAYVFIRSGTSWEQEAKLTAADAAAGDEFGSIVSISGNSIVAGAHGNDANGQNSGAVYAFVRNGAWSQQAKLTADDLGPDDHFGKSVSIYNNTIVAGTPQKDSAAGLNSGAIYVFQRAFGIWAQQKAIVGEAAEDGFGTSVSIYGDSVAVGAADTDDGGSGSGSMYAYTLSFSNAAPVLQSDIDPAYLDAIIEGTTDTDMGTLINEFLTRGGIERIIDEDAGAVQGIAVTAADNSNGKWQYSMDAGNNWMDFGAPANSAARLLAVDTDTRVRFLPDAKFNTAELADADKPKIIFRAWDRSDDCTLPKPAPCVQNGGVADTGINGGTAAYSNTGQTASISVDPATNAPVFVPVNDQFVSLNGLLALQIIADDPADDPPNILRYSLLDGPAGAAIDSLTGNFSWQAVVIGRHTVTIKAEEIDGVPENLSTTTSFNITVSNTAPVLAPIGDKTVALGETLEFTAAAVDAEGNTLIYSLENPPPGAMIDSISGKLVWTPPEAGIHNLSVTVSDSYDSDMETVKVAVGFIPPLPPIPPQYVIVGTRLNLSVGNAQSQTSSLNYRLLSPPAGADINPLTGEIDWTPGQTGTYSISIETLEPLAGFSTEEEIKVIVQKARTVLSLELDRPVISPYGLPLTLNGKLKHISDSTESLNGFPVELRITPPDGEAWSVFTETENGNYRFSDLLGLHQEGFYTLQTSFAGTDNHAATDLLPPQSLEVRAATGHAFIIQGGIADDPQGLEAYNKTLNRVYNRFKARGFEDESIKYFNYNSEQHGIEVDAMPVKQKIEEVFIGLQERMNANPAPFYLVMVDHGGIDGRFFIDDNDEAGNKENDSIALNELADWLDRLESGLSPKALTQPRIIIAGACYSGTMIPALSKPGRIIVTSTAATEESYQGPKEPDKIRSGEFFTEALFHSFGQGKSLATAFQIAVKSTEQLTRSSNSAGFNPYYQDSAAQHPLLDDNGDKTGSNLLSLVAGDGQQAERVYLGTGPKAELSGANAALEIESVTSTQYLGAEQSFAVLRAMVNNLSRTDKISVSVRPPSVELNSSGIEQTGSLSIEGMEQIILTDPFDGEFSGWFDGVLESGKYVVYYFAEDKVTGERSQQQHSLIYKNRPGNRPPGPFSLRFPEDGSRTSTVSIFDWYEAAEPDGEPLTYTFIVSTDPDFISANAEAFRREELAVSMTYIDKSMLVKDWPDEGTFGLRDGTRYYWKVEAVDAYGAKRAASEIFSFFTDETNVPPGNVLSGMIDSVVNLPPDLKAVTNQGNEPLLHYDAGPSSANYLAIVDSQTSSVSFSGNGMQAQTIDLGGNIADLTQGSINTNIWVAQTGAPLNSNGLPIRHGYLQFQTESVQVSEKQGILMILAERQGGSDGEISVEFTATDGSAVAGSGDYALAPAAILRWGDQDIQSKRIIVYIGDDQENEADEIFTLALFNPTGGASLGVPLRMTVTIAGQNGDTLAPPVYPVPPLPELLPPPARLPCPADVVILTVSCSAKGAEYTDLTVAAGVEVSDITIKGNVYNEGTVDNLTILPEGVFSGGLVSGIVSNQGIMENFTFNGTLLEGGTLSGTVHNSDTSVVQNVLLAAGASLNDGIAAGTITGISGDAPASLHKLMVSTDSMLVNVEAGEDVQYENWFWGENVHFLGTIPPEWKPVACSDSTVLNFSCDAKELIFSDVTVAANDSTIEPLVRVFNLTVSGHVENTGEIVNLTVQPGGTLAHGIVSGNIDNQGFMADFEFNGTLLDGGVLSGVVHNSGEGVIRDVQLAADTHLNGGIVEGSILGDADASVSLQGVTVSAGSQLANLEISDFQSEGWALNENVQVNGVMPSEWRLAACADNGTLTFSCDAQGLVFDDLTIEPDIWVFNPIVSGKLENAGTITGLTVLPGASVTGGLVSGVAVNQGEMADFEFTGSVLTNIGSGMIRNVKLTSDAYISGGKVAGYITGDANARASLANVAVDTDAELKNLVLGENVRFKGGMAFGDNVHFKDAEIIPAGLELIYLLPEKLRRVRGETGCAGMANARDLSSDVLLHGSGILEAINALPVLRDGGWAMEQESRHGRIQLTFEDYMRAAFQVTSIKKAGAAPGIQALIGQQVYFVTETGLGILGQPALQAPCVLQRILAELGFTEIATQVDGNMHIPYEQGGWFNVRPDWLSTGAATDAATGVFPLPVDSPAYLRDFISAYMVFADEEGRGREQLLYPSVAYLDAFSVTEALDLQPHGWLSFELEKVHYQGVVDYLITPGENASGALQLVPAEDVNGDGMADFILVYPAGERQTLFSVAK
ncbi:MAG: hypothetical protein GY862_26060 [Gammaproteobacteria bacterium]|nr:hypothetical protein [Gammaproteobacteria bacterium]